MKNLINSKITRKLLILVFMISGLFFIVNSKQFSQTVSAIVCCEDCPVYPGPGAPGGPAVAAYCADQCGASSGSCYDYCYLQATNCQKYCDLSCS